MRIRRVGALVMAAGFLLAGAAAQARDFEFGSLSGNLDSQLFFGGAWRVENPDADLIGKVNLNPSLCGDDGCMSFSGDPSRNQTLVDAPGAYFGNNRDDGNLSYDRGDMVAAVFKLSENLSLKWGEYKAEVGGFVFFDPVNYNGKLRHPDTTFQPASEERAGNINRELGMDLRLMKAFVSRGFELGERKLSLSVGWQRVRWGESTFNVLNSIDQINPPSQVLLHQPATPVSEIFLPTPLVQLGVPLTENVSLDVIYQLGWRGAQVDPAGSFYGVIDPYGGGYVTASPGGAHEDPQGMQRLAYPGNAISETSFTIPFGGPRDRKPDGMGQFGAKLSWYLPEFNNGTELSFYALNYHSQLPYASFIAAQQSCMRDSVSFVQAFVDCDGFSGLNPGSGLEPLPLDSARGVFEYPKNIHLVGVSFNTNLGKWSLAGEYAFRPNLPLQVAYVDVAYSAWQPALPRNDVVLGLDPAMLTQTLASLLPLAASLPSKNPQQLMGNLTGLLNGLPVILDVTTSGRAVTVAGARTAAPDFLSVYRGREVQPGELVHGYERFAVDQIDFTAIRSFGRSGNPFGADQLMLLAEVGATHIWNLPKRSELQIEGGDANDTHASPGADGTGSDGEADPRRFTATQQTGGFATSWAWGWKLLANFEYDQLFWGCNFKPSIMFGQDVSGIAPQPMQNFIAGRLLYAATAVVEIDEHWKTQLAYAGSSGGGSVNNLSDRDTVSLALGYNF